MKAVLSILRVSALLGGGFIFLSSFYFFLYSKPPRYHGSITPSDFGLSHEEVSIRTDDGKTLRAWFIPSKNTSSAIIMLHGWPADKSDILPYTHFLSKNFSLLYIDLRGMGESEGMICGGKKEINDIKRWIEYLKSRNIKKIGIFGYSYGGFIAARAVNEVNEIDFAIIDSTFDNIKEVLKKLILYKNPAEKILIPLISLNYALICRESIDTFSVEKAVKKIKKKILIICGDRDNLCFNKDIEHNLSDNNYVKTYIMKGFSHGETMLSKIYPHILNEFINKK